MSQQIELRRLAAHLAKAKPIEVIAVRFRDDGSIAILISPGKKLYFTPEQIAHATAELQPKPVPTSKRSEDPAPFAGAPPTPPTQVEHPGALPPGAAAPEPPARGEAGVPPPARPRRPKL